MICSRCQEAHSREGQRYCADCHADYMRRWRKANPLNDDQKLKDNCRYANVNKQRGKLVPTPCVECGDEAEMHHEDYTKPLGVIWLCRDCHLGHHRRERIQAQETANNKIREILHWLQAA